MNSEEHERLTTTRKKEFLVLLQELLNDQFKSREILDKKAWEVLTFTSGFIGLITSIQIGLTNNSVPRQYLIGFGVTLFLYILQVVFILLAIHPQDRVTVPGTSSGKPSWSSIIKHYVEVSNEDYFEQLVIDYVGNDRALGAIQIAQAVNQRKSRLILLSMILMCFIVIGLFAMSLLLI